MLYPNSLDDIVNNINTGIEYEIALFYKLSIPADQKHILSAINKRKDRESVLRIIDQTETRQISDALLQRGLTLHDVTFETQNDEVGPSDIVMYVRDKMNKEIKIGISVKYDNSCTCNCSYRYFLSTADKEEIKYKLPDYVQRHIKKMEEKFGDVSMWFRNRSYIYADISNEYIDLIRDKIIYNWERKSDNDKFFVMSTMLQMVSPIEYWIYTINKNRTSKLNTTPFHLQPQEVNRVKLKKNAGQFIQFSINSEVFANMQVKFNNGIIERHKYKRKSPDVEYKGVKMKYGDPFGSWNFSVTK